LETFVRKDTSSKYKWNIKTKKINFASLGLDKEEVERIRSIKQFEPWAADTQILFYIALKIAWLPTDWCTNRNSHIILRKESSWRVGILNYTIKWMSPHAYKKKVLNSSSRNPLNVFSTASWLGQLTLENIDLFYPSWRAWMWDCIEEAIWYFKYIYNRYWHPDVAMSIYDIKGWYTNARTWKKKEKRFEEWY
jgi:hypothetical protein